MIPTHGHRNIHSISFTPLRRMSCIWVQWSFGLMWQEGFAPYTTYRSLQWKPCPLCKVAHNQSIHGYIAFCPPHPLHKAWLHAWRHDPALQDWYNRASALDRQNCRPPMHPGVPVCAPARPARAHRCKAQGVCFPATGPGRPDATVAVTGPPSPPRENAAESRLRTNGRRNRQQCHPPLRFYGVASHLRPMSQWDLLPPQPTFGVEEVDVIIDIE